MNHEDIVAKLKARLQASRAEEQRRLQTAGEHGIEYASAHRAENLRLLRAYFDATHDDFAALLQFPGQPQYSQVERGNRKLTAGEARTIESDLGIPHMWLERRNTDALFLSQDGLSLVNVTRLAKPGAALALAGVIKLLTG